MPAWKGVIPAIVTPLRGDGSKINPEVLGHHWDFIIEKGVDGIFALGTTGEGPLLPLSERKSMVLRAQQTIELTKHCRDLGADAAGIVLPYYYKLDEEAICRHFMRIAEAVPDFPLFIYNIPQCSGNSSIE